ncbi:copper amine oxidase N-terminal domain-containing protein [Chakrabartyella piscis]|uniref:copper amine oxidase N-terminal domain-containing protein n=1 Tax=Chakrabartyella piscis TaxID=2918914 RepID=UPI002958B810|nr:copper amine oxidase N-terminal domain-containing protein [Chakrabartyella piscis]
MKRQRIKDIVATALVTALVVGTLPTVFATVGEMNIPVIFKDITVSIDGDTLEMEQEPFIYDGTTYLPIRAVAEAAGKDVSWDNDTRTVVLTTPEEEVVEEVEEEEIEEEIIEEEVEEEPWSVSMKENLVFGQGVTIYCSTFEEGSSKYTMNLKITNSTSMNYSASLVDMYVNGKLVTASFSASILPTAQFTDTLTVSKSVLESLGIDEIKSINLSFKIKNKDDSSGTYTTTPKNYYMYNYD